MRLGLAASADADQPAAAVDDNFRQMTFTFAVIALAAKVAHADGKVKKEEFQAFCALFPMPGEEQSKIHALFMMACREKSDVAHYAHRIVRLFPERASLRRELFARLCRLASADGPVNAPERQMLATVAGIMELPRNEAESLLAPKPRVSGGDPYALLGVSRRATPEAVKKAYRERIRRLHPDRLAADGHGAQEIERAQAELAAVNEAYRAIVRRRRFK